MAARTATLILLLLARTCELASAYTCPSTFVEYTDDGTEGLDSCLHLSSTTHADWAAASSYCAGLSAKLVTFGAIADSPSTNGLLNFLVDTYPSKSFWVGASQATSSVDRRHGWSWVDGGANVNINVASAGLGIWASTQPNDAPTLGADAEANWENYASYSASIAGGLTDSSLTQSFTYTACEIDVPSPTPSPSRTVTGTVTVSATTSVTPSSTVTASSSSTATTTATGTVTVTSTLSPTRSASASASVTSTVTMTASLSVTVTSTATASPTNTGSGSRTVTLTATASGTASTTATATTTSTSTSTGTATTSCTPTASVTAAASATTTETSTQTATVSATAISATATGSTSFTTTVTETATASATTTFTATSTVTSSVSSTLSPTVTATTSTTTASSFSATATSTATASPTTNPTLSPSTTASCSVSLLSSGSESASATVSATASETGTITATRSITVSAGSSASTSTSPSYSASTSGTLTVTLSVTASRTASLSASSTESVTDSTTGTHSATATASSTSTASATMGASASSSSTATVSVTAISALTKSTSSSTTASTRPSESISDSSSVTRATTCTSTSTSTIIRTSSSTSTITSTPSSSASAHAVQRVLSVGVGEWSKCTAPCGGGLQFRDVFCLADSRVAADASVCAGLPVNWPASTAPCNTAPCLTYYWLPAQRWQPCSSPCFSGSPDSLGVTHRDPPVCMLGSEPAPDEACLAAGLAAPATVKACNRSPCLQSVFAWGVSPWSACATAAGEASVRACGQGAATRSVTCVALNGTGISAELCDDSAQPTSTTPCDTGVECECAANTDCTGVHSTCDFGTGACVCLDGWLGSGCAVPDLSVTSQFQQNGDVPSSVVCTGVVDVARQCCQGEIDSTTGLCCSGQQSVGSDGRCCAGAVDVCGVCNGKGVAVDALGVCCANPLAPSGLCCGAVGMDSCGTCGGVDECAAVVQLQVDAGALVAGPPVGLEDRVAQWLKCDAAMLVNVVQGVDVNGKVQISFGVSVMAAFPTQALLGSLYTSVSSASNVSVVRLNDCGNSRCERGEECTDPSCSLGCSTDCPAFSAPCPGGPDRSSVVRTCSGAGVCAAGRGSGSAGTCACQLGYTGNACQACAPEYLRVRASGPCVFLPGSLSSCADGVRNGNEEGPDCGGSNCAACPITFHLSNAVIGAAAGVLAVFVCVCLWCIRRLREKRQLVRLMMVMPGYVGNQDGHDGKRGSVTVAPAPVAVNKAGRKVVPIMVKSRAEDPASANGSARTLTPGGSRKRRDSSKDVVVYPGMLMNWDGRPQRKPIII